MKIISIIQTLIAAWLPLALHAQVAANSKSCMPCERLLELRLPDVKVLKAESLQYDTIEGQIITVPFCRVLGRISKEINFELLLPQEWNGRFVMGGGGGFVGSIQNYNRYLVNNGFATVGTDTGHQGDGLQADWALDNMERQINFGRLAVHRTAVVSKSVIHSYYCADAAYSYFLGCSRGGGQAMVEAQFYPDDFNGIVAAAPAFNWPAIGAKFNWVNQMNYPKPGDLSKPVITPDNLKLLQDYVLQQCDNLDGVKDKIINDPRDCKVDVSKLPVCPNNQAGPTCFTKEQLAAIRTVYEPLLVDQKTVYPGFPVGSENERGSWDVWISGTSPDLQKAPSLHYMFGTNMFKYLVFNDPEWDYHQYDFKNFFEETRYASSYLDATQTDYGEFKKRNGKLIFYHGWNDPALSAFATIQHYEEVMQKDKETQSWSRLFLLPGVLHCGGGVGPDNIDWVKLIQEWVENGKAPERLVLSKTENGKVVMTRPVYPYPKVTVYDGKGDPNLEKSFTAKTK